jgi:hypothetical protein
MLDAMAKLAVTGELGILAEESVTFREFQALIEQQYFRRKGSDGLARAATGAAPPSHMRLAAVGFDKEERKTGTGR